MEHTELLCVSSVQSFRLGQTPVYVSEDDANSNSAFIRCDELFCRFDLHSAGSAKFSIHNIWLTDHNEVIATITSLA